MNAKQIITAAIGALTSITPAFAYDGVTSGLAWLAGLGLAQVLLWVLTFAVVFAVLTRLNIFGRAASTLISIVAGIFVLMTVPVAVITVIATMSTGLVVLAIGIIALLTLLVVSGGPTAAKWFEHPTAVALALIILTAIMFVAAGGLPLIGIPTIPVIGWGTWLLIIVAVAVLWMLSEAAPKEEKKKE